MIDKDNRKDSISKLARLRMLVAFLGEEDSYDWWPTSFLSETGLKMLAYNFPRTVLSAGIGTSTEAAKKLHDSRIGTSGHYHLFRLTHELEADIHRYLRDIDTESWKALIVDKETAETALADMSGEASSGSDGPIRLGTIADLVDGGGMEATAGHYLQAFQNGTQVFPYFSVESV